jgi:hypothetical protein
MPNVSWFREAHEDLRHIGDVVTMAKIIELAERELDPQPADSSIEGSVSTDPRVKWRRCIPRGDRERFESFEPDDQEGEFRVNPYDYVLAYRALTVDEAIDNHLPADTILVLRVLSNTQMATLIRTRPVVKRPVPGLVTTHDLTDDGG